MSVRQWVRPFRLAILFTLSAAGICAGVLVYDQYQESHQIGRIAATVVTQEIDRLKQEPLPVQLVGAQPGWPDDFIALQSWFILRALQKPDPLLLLTELSQLSRNRQVSPVMRTSLKRWNDSLQRWAVAEDAGSKRTPGYSEIAGRSPEQLFLEGRKYHDEAVGYERVGRAYDATALYLWSFVRLSEFIREAPLHESNAEALYLLGKIYTQFKHALPTRVRADRFLNLCKELYPDTIWAARGHSL